MKITIHRGINQIGGCITGIESASGTKILIDLGHNLPDAEGQVEDEYDVQENLDRLLDGVSAVFYTHYHGDHIAFEAAVAERGVDQYLGYLAKKVKLQFYAHMQNIPVDNLRQKYESAILHTGDFRDHGYLGKYLKGVLSKFIARKSIDVLITEGTMLSRNDVRMMSEEELQQKAYELMSGYKYTFVLCSSTDPDRLVSFYQATRHQGRPFIADGYQCKLLETFTKFTKQLKPNHRIYDFTDAVEYDGTLRQPLMDTGFTMVVRNSDKFRGWLDELMPLLPKEETVFIYSQFKGYILTEHTAYSASTDSFVHSHDWNLEYLHTSGHASRDALAMVCNTVNPTSAIIPIHREKGSDFTSLDISEELKDRVVTSDTTVDDIEIRVQ